jgi:MATE family multidrug resistance protein
MSVNRNQPFHLTGGFRELLLLFFPILLMSFSSYIFLLVEKLFLARLSIQAMEAAVNAAYACQIVQVPCVSIAMMAQVYVGRWHGAHEWRMIGPGIWQFIWFSLLSMVITLPFSFAYGSFYFHGTDLEGVVLPYFYFHAGINFLYPLGTTLICFYLGQGRTRLVLVATVGAQLVKLILTYLLIFGWKDWVPTLGLMGGAVGTLVAQGAFCIILFAVFLNSRHSQLYHSREGSLQPKLFWKCIHPGLLRALSRVLMVASWASIARLMTAKGGDYLLILSIGGTLFLFLPFLAEAICQAQTTIVSNILGARNYNLMDKAFHSGTLLVLANIALFSIPLLIFPIHTFQYLFPNVMLNEMVIRSAFWGIWLCFACYTFYYIPISYILAFKDTKFLLFMGIANWINGFLLMYFAIETLQIKPENFWFVLSLMHGSMAILYYLRMKRLQWKISYPAPTTV